MVQKGWGVREHYPSQLPNFEGVEQHVSSEIEQVAQGWAFLS